MTVNVFHDVDGRITSYSPSASMSADDIVAATPSGGGYIVTDDFPNVETQYVSGGVLTDRPALTTVTDWSIEDDGVESAWFEAPAGTVVLVTLQDQDTLLNGEDDETASPGIVVFNATVFGVYVVRALPPFPYLETEITVTVGNRDTDDPETDPEPVPTRGDLTYGGMPLTYDGMTLTYAILPVLVISITQPVPTGLVGHSKARANVWEWDDSEDPYHHYWEITFYENSDDADADENGETITPIYEPRYRDKIATAIGDNLWARVNDVNKDGHRSAKSDWATVTAAGVETDDVKTGGIEPVNLNSEVISVSNNHVAGPISLSGGSRNILAEITLTFEAVDADVVNRRFSLFGVVGSTSTSLTAVGRLFFNIDTGSGWILPLGTYFDQSDIRLLSGNATASCQSVYLVGMAGSATEITFGLEVYLESGESGELKNCNILVVHHATAEAA